MKKERSLIYYEKRFNKYSNDKIEYLDQINKYDRAINYYSYYDDETNITKEHNDLLLLYYKSERKKINMKLMRCEKMLTNISEILYEKRKSDK